MARLLQCDRWRGRICGTLLAWALAVLPIVPASAHAAGNAVSIPAPLLDDARLAGKPQTAVLAGGCFWGMQGVFEHLKGVRRVLAGYSGGSAATAHYALVGGGTTGHAESVQISFDPGELSYGDILRVYFSVAHDPTELNRQGPDQGMRYRSEIFYADARQQAIAQAYIAQLQQERIFPQPIVTRLDPLTGFYAAEDYHQDFLVRNTDYGYIVQNDLPKIANLKRLYPRMYLDQPVLVGPDFGNRLN
jgi:peptide-methionine (S)-S-oxide reductase